MVRRGKMKGRIKKRSISTNEALSKIELDSESIVRLKLTTRKGTRIESVPLKKLEKLANKTNLYWKLEEDWLTLIGLS